MNLIRRSKLYSLKLEKPIPFLIDIQISNDQTFKSVQLMNNNLFEKMEEDKIKISTLCDEEYIKNECIDASKHIKYDIDTSKNKIQKMNSNEINRDHNTNKIEYKNNVQQSKTLFHSKSMLTTFLETDRTTNTFPNKNKSPPLPQKPKQINSFEHWSEFNKKSPNRPRLDNIKLNTDNNNINQCDIAQRQNEGLESVLSFLIEKGISADIAKTALLIFPCTSTNKILSFCSFLSNLYEQVGNDTEWSISSKQTSFLEKDPTYFKTSKNIFKTKSDIRLSWLGEQLSNDDLTFIYNYYKHDIPSAISFLKSFIQLRKHGFNTHSSRIALYENNIDLRKTIEYLLKH